MAVQDSGALLVGLLLLFHTWGAWAAVEVSMEDRVEVFRGQTAQITCMFQSDDGVGGLTIQWSYVIRGVERQRIYYQDSTTNEIDRRTRFTDRISVEGNGATGQVVLTIRDVQLEDELDFICQIKSLTDGKGEGLTKLKVFVIPEPPTIEAVGKGISISEEFPSKIATCEVKNGFPRPNITWYKNGIPQYNVPDVVNVLPTVTVESSGLFSVKSELSLKVTMEDKDATLYCDVSFFVPGETRMFESKNFTITVYYPSTSVNVWVESPKGKIKEGDSVELHCSGDGNTPSIFTMKHKDVEHSDSTWVLENVTRLQTGNYECSSMDTDTYEEITGTVNVFVNYLDPAVVKPDGPAELAIGAEMMATCNALSSLKTQTTWFKDGQEISKGNTLNLKDATLDTAGTYKCVVTAPEIEGMETSGMLEVHVQSPPEITKPDSTDIEETFENIVKLECKARGFPVPTVMWTTSDGKVLKTASQEETKDGVLLSVTSFKVTSDVMVFCNASNAYGTDAVTFNIKATTHTTTSATTTTTSPTTISSTTTTISSATVKPETAIPPKRIKKEGSGVIIAVIIICILLLAVLGSVLYYLYKKGKICGRSGKQDLTKEKSNKDNIVVEMKSDNTEEAVLLGVNGEKQPTSDQSGEYLDVQK